MASTDEYGFFWDSENGDRKYNAASFEKWLRKFFTSGVFNGELQVVEYSGMTVSVTSGYTNANGKVKFFEQATQVTLDAPNSTYPRIDTVVIRRDDANRNITIEKVTGAYSGNSPAPTAPVRTGGIYEFVLAQIYVGAGVSSISQADITDTRTDPDICGYVTGTVEEIDFSEITAQFEAYMEDFEAENLAEFEAWFDHMKDQLDTDAAGHLQAEIDAMDELAYTSSDDTASPTASVAVDLLTSGEAATSRWGKVSQMFKNIRYLLGKLGTTDISTIGNGTVTGAISTVNGNYNTLRSHVGMIIHTTTLDTEAKVKAIYGGTTWVKIEGRFLLGQSSGHAVNSTGGAETVTLTISQIPSHDHGVGYNVDSGVVPNHIYAPPASPNTGVLADRGLGFGASALSGGGQAHDNMPPFKTVYIWERTA